MKNNIETNAEHNIWKKLCEDLVERLEEIPNLQKTINDRKLIEKYYELKNNTKK
jgi:hypothetical protein